ncbi:MAG: amino acid adenylation domain-containing protein [Caldilineaceae bacterium]
MQFPVKSIKANIFPLSSAQMRVWLDQQLNPSTFFYRISHLYEINGDLDVTLLHQALTTIVSRHEILRSIFYEYEGMPVQQVLAENELPLPFTDLRDQGGDTYRGPIQRLVDQELKRPFNLSAEWPIRVRLIQTGSYTYLFILVMHHIAGDQWSTGVFYRELSEIYNALKRGQKPDLTPLLIQYKDYALLERETNSSQSLTDRDYWFNQLKGELPILDLPFDKPRPTKQTFHGQIERTTLNIELWQALKSLGFCLQVTPFMLLLSAYIVLLYRITGQTELLVGTFLANRQRKELIPLIGILFNNLPICINIEDDPTFVRLVNRVRDLLLDDFEHMNYSYDELVQQPNVPRIGNRPMLYNASFQLYHERREDALHMDGLEVKRRRIVDDALYDLMGYAQERDDGLRLWFNYNSDVFEAESIRRFLGYFHCLLISIAQNSDANISKLEMLASNEKQDLLETFNNTSAPYPRNKSIQDIFQEQVNQTPNHPALINPDKPENSLSYQELNCRANQLAHYLVRQGIQLNQVVGILLERSAEVFIAYLAILKIGAICLIIDVNLPRERIRYMTRDTRSKWVITTQSIDSRNYLRSDTRQIDINLEDIWSESKANLVAKVDGVASATIIYTSGSSGRPKGVELRHQGLINQVYHRMKILNLSQRDTLCLSLSTGFVTMPLQIFCALFIGAPVIIYPQSIVSDPLRLLSKVAADEVTVVEVTVSSLKTFLDIIKDIPPIPLPHLRTLLVAGEKLTPGIAKSFYQHYPGIDLMNAYGQTECSGMTLSTLVPRKPNLMRICEGYPSQNNHVYLLDEHGSLVPLGVKGELYISGDGLARGYVHKPSMTKEKFIPHPFSPGDTIYRTGDLGRRWADGAIEVIGRIDDLVKIRGFRVEPGEIASILQQYPNIQRTHVTSYQEDDQIILAAYYTTQEGNSIDPIFLKSYLEQYLPPYMIPHIYERLDVFHFNSNGKLDKKAFPKPQMQPKQGHFSLLQPATNLERGIASIWEDILRITNINANDNFLNLNGHSLHAVQIVSRINHRFGLKLAASTVFDYPTVAQLAAFVATMTD